MKGDFFMARHKVEICGVNTANIKVLSNEEMVELFENIIDKRLLVRRINMAFINVVDKDKATNTRIIRQVDLFNMDDEELMEDKVSDHLEEEKLQLVMLDLKKKYGKNAILKGMNLEDGATTIERNSQIGGHKA